MERVVHKSAKEKTIYKRLLAEKVISKILIFNSFLQQQQTNMNRKEN